MTMVRHPNEQALPYLLYTTYIRSALTQSLGPGSQESGSHSALITTLRPTLKRNNLSAAHEIDRVAITTRDHQCMSRSPCSWTMSGLVHSISRSQETPEGVATRIRTFL
ncbi:hypothetical protein FOYG_16496 [Fusarium oxysporum NRRL 32931]|uniref:Uncharacterized protein n=2 Tax=Fusarium oxysporum NRRL 32931 TaxID=660029 RepID=W9HDA7_FUSOX|nr:hypothetical protein FOYG_16496 [Fusarium oxysporum NRRL 32931]EWY80533.1 hypothetical protein FOYG_16496 [Fusarium oxysporum NRRL 32931]EWZ89179.1 hypothetical protein FOWG_08915 [Fusarium oxysporum f. sp. lycopersici MN25]EWZ89180.1 hypothetical protein FOWG_08915 [Fusarium oxysporum f. sp. lycopersici MN25]KAK2486338.1 hypothetical protein H9L39_00265 [Fusarium oxysporum f. sp. albedinis]